MIEITTKPISIEDVVEKAKCNNSGCVVTYVGLIRDYSHCKPVLSVEYRDTNNTATNTLQEIATAAKQRWQVNKIALTHRIGILSVGDINLVVAVASTHRNEGFSVCEYIIDQFKHTLPTEKTEVYRDTDVLAEK